MSNRRLFYINYGAGARLTSTIVEADDWLSAETYAYQEAKDDFYDNVGTGDLLSLEQFLERNHCEDGDENAIYEYDEYVEDMIHFTIEPYKVENEEHYSTFQLQSFEPEII